MIFGAHVVVYSKDATADRTFFREVLGFSSVDAGHGWLIFALPPAEVAIHPAEEDDRHELYFMCDDLMAEISALGKKGVRTEGNGKRAHEYRLINPMTTIIHGSFSIDVDDSNES